MEKLTDYDFNLNFLVNNIVLAPNYCNTASLTLMSYDVVRVKSKISVILL